MSTGDSSPPTRRNAKPDSENPASQSPNDPARPDASHDADSGQPVDFGSYVSSTVRSSAALFGAPARSGRSGRRTARSADRTPGSSPPSGSALPPTEVEDEPVARQRNRPRTYWRDSVSSDRDDGPRVTYDDGDGGGDRGGKFPWRFPDDNRTRMLILGGAALVLVAIVALIWVLNRDGDGSGTQDPTATMESVLDAAPTATEAGSGAETDDPPSTPTGFEPATDQEPAVTPTDEVRRGGDNQINADDPGTPDASRTDDPLAVSRTPIV